MTQRILSLATDGVKLRRMQTERYSFPFSRLISRGVLIDDGNLLPAERKPLRAYQVEPEPRHFGPGKVCIAGPGMKTRRLLIEEQIVRDWVRENRRVIESHRVRWMNRQSPQVMVVLQECRSNTWVRLSSRNVEEINGIKVSLFQDSPESAARWSCLHMNEGLSTPQLVRNVEVYLA